MRKILACALALVVIGASLVSATSSNDQNMEYMCGNGACHSYASIAIITMESSDPSPIISERNVTVRVTVQNSEQEVGRNVSVQLVSRIQLAFSQPSADGWVITRDANDNANPSNYCQKKWNGSIATFEWTLTAPPTAGNYKLYANYIGGHDKPYYKTNTTGLDFSVHEEGVMLLPHSCNETIEQGSAASFPIEIRSIGGYTGSANISVECALENATIDHPSVCFPGIFFVNVTTAGTTPFGDYEIDVAASYTPGDCAPVTKHVTVWINVTSSGNFEAIVDSTTKSGYAGENSNFTIILLPNDGFDEKVDFSLSCNNSLNPSLPSNNFDLPCTFYLNVTPSPAMRTGIYPIILAFSGGNHNNMISLEYEILDFSIEAPAMQTVRIGGNATIAITLATNSTFERAISLSMYGIPENVTAQLSDNNTYAPRTIALNLTADETTLARAFELQIIASGGNRTHERTVVINIVENNDFIVTLPSQYAKLSKNATCSFSIFVEKIGNMSSLIKLSAISDLECTLAPSQLYAGNASNLVVNITESASPSLHQVRIIANASGKLRESTLAIDVMDFMLVAETYNMTLFGGNASVKVSMICENGFDENANLTYISEVQCALDQSLNATQSATLRFSADALSAGAHEILLQASSGSLIRMLKITVYKRIDDHFDIELAPSSKRISQYSSASFLVGLSCNQTFNGTVSLLVVGLPPEVECVISPAKLSASSRTSTITLTPHGKIGVFNFTLAAHGAYDVERAGTLEVVPYVPFALEASGELHAISGSWQEINLTLAFLEDCNEQVMILTSGLECKASPSFVSPLAIGNRANVTLSVRAPAGTSGIVALRVNASSQKYTCGLELRINFTVDPAHLGFVIEGKRNITSSNEIKFMLGIKNTGIVVDMYEMSVCGLGKTVALNISSVQLPPGASAKFNVRSSAKNDKISLTVISQTNGSVAQTLWLSGKVIEETPLPYAILALVAFVLCAFVLARPRI